jgi:hypothetical protein
MLALLAAATVTATPVAPPQEYRWIYRAQGLPCRTSQGMLQTKGMDPALLYRNDGKARVQNLGALPKANLYQTVLRSVGSCAVTTPVRYNVGR